MEVIEPTPAKARTTFLTVICVLTFIGSGWGVVDSIIEYGSADIASSLAREAIDEAQMQLEDDEEVPGFVESIFSSVTEDLTPGNIRKLSILGLIANILTLSGAILMWNLRKLGFSFYVAGIAVLVISPLAVMGSGLTGMMSAGGAGFFGVLFIVLYALNLKQMR